MLHLTETAKTLCAAGYRDVPSYSFIRSRVYSGELPMFEKRGRCWETDMNSVDKIAAALGLKKRADQSSARS